MVAFHAILVEHSSEEQHKKTILKSASLTENATKCAQKGSPVRLVDMKNV